MMVHSVMSIKNYSLTKKGRDHLTDIGKKYQGYLTEGLGKLKNMKVTSVAPIHILDFGI